MQADSRFAAADITRPRFGKLTIGAWVTKAPSGEFSIVKLSFVTLWHLTSVTYGR
jgi:hypothetical protein